MAVWNGQSSCTSRAIERMQIALILEYQKSVNLHTLNRLHAWLCATRSRWMR
jgi:hypothetical protein